MKEDSNPHTSAQVRTKCGAKFCRKRARGEICKCCQKWRDSERASDSACSCVIFTRKWAAVWSVLILEKVRRHLPPRFGPFCKGRNSWPVGRAAKWFNIESTNPRWTWFPTRETHGKPVFSTLAKSAFLQGLSCAQKDSFGWGVRVGYDSVDYIFFNSRSAHSGGRGFSKGSLKYSWV